MKVKFVNYELYRRVYPSTLIELFDEGFVFDEENCITVADFAELIIKELRDRSNYADAPFPGKGAIEIIGKESKARYYLNYESQASFTKLLEFFNIADTIEIKVFLIVGAGGEVCHNDGSKIGVKYVFRSNEGNHLGCPHVHVFDIGTNAVIRLNIQTLEKLSNNNTRNKEKFPKKKEKQVKHYIKEHQQEFIKYWNSTTNGFDIEIEE